MQIKRGENIIEHEKEIYSRPARTWFQTEKDKQKSAGASRLLGNGSSDPPAETSKQQHIAGAGDTVASSSKTSKTAGKSDTPKVCSQTLATRSAHE